MNKKVAESGKTFLPSSLSRRSLAKYGLPFLTIAVLLLGMAGYQVYVSRVAAFRAAATNASNLALVLESKLNSEFTAADRTVAAMVSEIHPEAMRSEMVGRYQSQVTHWLKTNVGNVPLASALQYFDANGDRLYTSADDEPKFNIADRPHFKKLKADPSDSTVFSDVLLGRTKGRVSMIVARSIRGKDGSFLGSASTVIDISLLHEHFGGIDVGKEGVVALRRLDNGASIARAPGPIEVDNKPVPDLPVRHAILGDGPVGVMNITSRIDGSVRMYGYRRIGALPFFVAVGLADKDFLAEWHRNTVWLTAASLMLLATLAAVFYRLAVAESRRDESEDRLRDSEKRYHDLFDQANEGLLMMTEDGQVIEANSVFARMHGYTVDELKRMDIGGLDVLGERTLEGRAEIVHHIQAGEVVRFEAEHYHKDGHLFPLSVTTSMISLGRKKYYLAFHQDITERRRAERAAKRERVRLETILRMASDGIHVVDGDGLLVEANAAFLNMLGYDESAIGKLHVTDWAAAEPWAAIKARNDDLIARRGQALFEAPVRRRDGTTLDMEINAAGIEIEGKGYLYAAFRDVTGRKRAESERTRLEAQLRESQKMEALGTLAGGIAHDFNNVLAMIAGNVELARQDVGPGHPALESLEEIAKANRRSKDLVQQVLAFARRQTSERKPTSLSLVVLESARLLRASLPAKVSLKVDCKADTPAVLADATQVNQILLNLCNNAAQALEGLHRAGVIEVRLEACTVGEARADLKAGRYACLTVRDNGSGMNEATRARIFEPFFTTKQVGQGTGLGLSVVHGIAQAHEASIEVESSPGDGSTIRIYFPAIDVSVPAVAAPVPGTAPLEGKGRHILLVDDEEGLVFLMKRLLERQGFRFSGFTDPREAIAAVRANPEQFDVVVTDYNMPFLSGLEVASAARQIRPDLPVVLASGYITEELRAKAPAAGVSELIHKPNTVDDLCAAIMRYANAHKVGKTSKPS